ncbi:MAG TPA: hypothetical protein VGK67_05450 [Myxococcales bacterium]|jgi:hypothetical protein
MGKSLYVVAAALVLACSGPAAKPDAGTSCGSLSKCKGECVDIQTDNENCGVCGGACNTTSTCVKGACYLKTCSATVVCTADQICKGAVCLDKTCIGITCNAGETCSGGTCKSSCVPDQDCTVTNPCKTGTTSCATGKSVCAESGDAPDGTNCGAADMACTAGVCTKIDRCANVTCSGTTKICDPASGKCVACLVKSDCTSSLKPACDTATKKCVECLTETDCASSTVSKFCDRALKTCSGCDADAQCITATAPNCLSAEHRCVGCVDAADCAGNPNGQICSLATRTCTTCQADADCASSGPGWVCDLAAKTCVECLDNLDCAGSFGGAFCLAAEKRCVECLAGADCGFEKKGCLDHRCGKCAADTDCPGPTDLCSEADNLCHCSADTDCGGGAPVCNTEPGVYLCGCKQTSDCPTGKVCDTFAYPQGTCAAPCTATSCNPNGAAPYCNLTVGAATYGVCLPCLSNTDCSQGEFCTATGCVGCRNDADCTDPTKPNCRGQCMGCVTWQDCTNPAALGCNFNTHLCGSCVDDFDCPDTSPVCLGGKCGTSGADAGSDTCGGCAPNEVCDPSDNTCVQCLANADCAAHYAPLSICDTTVRACLECKASSDCPFSRPNCLFGACLRSCQASSCKAPLTCGTDGYCHCDATKPCGGDAPVCLTDKTCGCTANADCPNGGLCDPVTISCTAPCGASAPCSPDGRAPYCDATAGSPFLGLCLPCASNAACAAQSATTPYCTPYDCAECRTAADCSVNKPICAGRCKQCEKPAQCDKPEFGCNSGSFMCGSCNLNSDCPTNVCNNGVCKL